MAKRKYTKRSDYWKKFEKNFQYPNSPYESVAGKTEDYEHISINDTKLP